jgi:hypothetical protein
VNCSQLTAHERCAAHAGTLFVHEVKADNDVQFANGSRNLNLVRMYVPHMLERICKVSSVTWVLGMFRRSWRQLNQQCFRMSSYIFEAAKNPGPAQLTN